MFLLLSATSAHRSYKKLDEYLENDDIESFRHELLRLHQYNQMKWFEQLQNPSLRKNVYKALSAREFAAIFQKLKLKDQVDKVQELEDTYQADVFSAMSTNRLADLFNRLPEHVIHQSIDQMDAEQARTVMQLMKHEEGTAGALMTTEFVSLNKDLTIEQAIEKLRAFADLAETIYYVYVENDQHQLVGVVSLRHLLAGESTKTLEEIMKEEVIQVVQDKDQEDIAKLTKDYDLIAIPVVDDDRHLLGIIMVDEIMDVVEEEATEDLGEFAASRGALGIEISALLAAKKRAPWIMGLLLIGMVTAQIISFFENTLQEVVMLSAFIPLVMGAAGNTGTQTLAVIVRSISNDEVKKGVWKIILRELSAGFMIGICSAAVLLIVIPIFYNGNWPLAFIVGGSVFLALGFATFIGCVIPIIINKLNIDQAVASGPFITTLNDMVSIVIYFLIATSFLQYLQ
ncbi:MULTISPECIES: magnesium transporter [Allobacillus]|uniref:Magnesium transporter MgtE n=1 Tax=Allobacillus salarius TaxID=1955272 RepID=A0A556PGS8_9BACI|nr:magnesium transporter [Allobacillus salarius]TSJ63588.1 magnesium transporter [Allobacillus salarius]